MVIGAFSIYLQAKGFIGVAETILIASITGGFVVVKTIDRVGDKRVEVAKIAATSASDVAIITQPITGPEVIN